MKKLATCLTALALFVTACGTSQAAPNLSNATPGAKVALSDRIHTSIVPAAVVPYGRKAALALTGLSLSSNGSTVDGKVHFSQQGQDDFTLVVYLSTSDEVLIAYLDPKMNLTLDLPGGTALFGLHGYKLSGQGSGTIEFAVTAKTFGVYDITGKSGTAYIFAVPGTVNPQSTLPGDQTDAETYQANSNVLTGSFRF